MATGRIRLDKVVLYRARRLGLVLIGGAMITAVGGYLSILRAGYGLSAVFLLCGIGMLLDRRPRLTVSTTGIEFQTWGMGEVPWEHFAAYYWTHQRDLTFLVLVPQEIHVLASRLSAFGKFNDLYQRVIGQPRFAIPLATIAGDLTEAELILRSKLPEGEQPPSPTAAR